MSILRERKTMSDVDAQAIGLIAGEESFTVCLLDGQQITAPFCCFPRLEAATPQQRAHFEVYAGGRMLHWPEIDEDIEIQHLVEGKMPKKGES